MANLTITDNWTEEKCLQLIREYRSRPELWDQKDLKFFKKDLRPIAWQEIGAAMNVSGDQCKRKMIILMSSFRREKSRIMNSIKKINDDPQKDLSQAYKSTWFAFKDMAFLLDKKSERKRLANLNSNDVDEPNTPSVKYTILSHNVEPAVKKARIISAKSDDHTQEVASTLQEEPRIPQLQPRPGCSQTPTERDEEIKSFMLFIGNKMKKYTDSTKNSVQQAICDIIFKADQNYYENACFEKFTIIDDDTDPLNRHVYEDGTIIKVQNDSESD